MGPGLPPALVVPEPSTSPPPPPPGNPRRDRRPPSPALFPGPLRTPPFGRRALKRRRARRRACPLGSSRSAVTVYFRTDLVGTLAATTSPRAELTPTCTTKPSRRATEPSGQIAPTAAHPPWPTRTAHAADPPTPTREVRNDQGVAAGRRDDARPRICSVFPSLCPRRPYKSLLVTGSRQEHQAVFLATPLRSCPLPPHQRNSPSQDDRRQRTATPSVALAAPESLPRAP